MIPEDDRAKIEEWASQIRGHFTPYRGPSPKKGKAWPRAAIDAAMHNALEGVPEAPSFYYPVAGVGVGVVVEISSVRLGASDGIWWSPSRALVRLAHPDGGTPETGGIMAQPTRVVEEDPVTFVDQINAAIVGALKRHLTTLKEEAARIEAQATALEGALGNLA